MRGAVRHLGLTTLLSVVLVVPALAAIVVDGNLDAQYGSAASIQAVQTNFGDNNDGNVDTANGSELDGGYAVVIKDNLHIFLSGALESNFNKLELFLDVHAGGQNQLRGDNPDVDFNGLNRMGDEGTGNGLKFDAGFAADYYLTMGGGGGPYELFANYAELLTSGGGSGGYLGQTGAASDGVLSGGANPNGILVTINNSNTGGVGGAGTECLADGGAAGTTGIEIVIPFSALGGTVVDDVKICAFVNGSGHDFLSNQVLGPLAGGTCNLGEPRAVDFGAQAGNQWFSSRRVAAPAANAWLLVLASLALIGTGAVVLRRRQAFA